MKNLSLPRSIILLLVYAFLNLVLWEAVIHFHLPDALLYFLVMPILWAAFFYPNRLGLLMTALLAAISVLISYAAETNIVSALITILTTLVTGIISILLIQSYVNQQKQHQAQIEEAKERYRIIAEFTSDFEYWQNPDGTFNYVSPSCERITGYKREEFMQKPNLYYEIIHKDDRDRMINAHKITGKDRSLIPIEFRIFRRDGQERWLEHVYQKVYDNQDKFIGWRGNNRDITQRKLVEDSLFTTTLRLQLAFEGTEDGVWDWDASVGEIYLSPNYARLVGLTSNRLTADFHNLTNFLHPEDVDESLQALKDCLNGKTNSLKTEFRAHTGADEWRWVMARGKVAYSDENGQPTRVIGTFVDITERKIIEQALQASEQRYRDLVEQQGEGIVITDNDLKFIFANPVANDIFGFSDGSLVGHNFKEFLSEEQATQLIEKRSRPTLENENSYEVTITPPNREKTDLLITTTPRFNAQGENIGAVEVFRNITQRKQEEEELRYISLHDSLTGVYNRAFFKKEIARLENSDLYPVSIIVADINDMKIINDLHGHPIGDDVLVDVAEILKRAIRKRDILARIGGDEFAIVLPTGDEVTLEQVLERINEGFVTETQKNKYPFSISVSIGGTTSYKKGALKAAFTQADAEMYIQKKAFHNKRD